MDNKCVEKLLETVAFSNGCICSVELIRWEHTHFHHSGNSYPSETDCMVTDKIAKISSLIEIPLLDHIIVGTDMKKYFSFHEKGMLINPVFKLAKKYEDVSLNKPGIPKLDCF